MEIWIELQAEVVKLFFRISGCFVGVCRVQWQGCIKGGVGCKPAPFWEIFNLLGFLRKKILNPAEIPFHTRKFKNPPSKNFWIRSSAMGWISNIFLQGFLLPPGLASRYTPEPISTPTATLSQVTLGIAGVRAGVY